MEKDIEIGELLSKLLTEEGMALAVYYLVRKGIEVPEEYKKKALSYFEIREPFRAVEIYEWTGDKENAERLYRQILERYEDDLYLDVRQDPDLYIDVARVAQKLGMNERAKKLYLGAIRLLEKKCKWARAAAVAEMAGEKDLVKIYRILSDL
jgi:tetratricopeptide (TPR) repeat protein